MIFCIFFSCVYFLWRKQLNMLTCPKAISFSEEVLYSIPSWQLLGFGFVFKSLFLGKTIPVTFCYRYFQREKVRDFLTEPFFFPSLPALERDTFCYFHLNCYRFNKVTYASSMNLTELWIFAAITGFSLFSLCINCCYLMMAIKS